MVGFFGFIGFWNIDMPDITAYRTNRSELVLLIGGIMRVGTRTLPGFFQLGISPPVPAVSGR